MPLKLTRRKLKVGWSFYLRGTVRGQRVYEATGTTDRAIAEAIRIKREKDLLHRAVFGARASVTLAEAAASYLEVVDPGPAERVYVRRILDHLCPGWDTGRALRPWPLVASIDQSAIDRLLAAILRPGAKPATRSRTSAPLVAILNHAARRGWCDVPRFERQKRSPPRTVWLTPAEATILVDHAADHARPIFRFMLGTGARTAEALELDWRDVDLQAARCTFRDTKNGSDRIAALPPAIVAELAELRHRDGLVFRTHGGGAYADKDRTEGGQLKTALKGALRRAAAAGRPIGKHVTPHSLRHTWATWFYAATRDPMLLRDEGGWHSLAMVERYAKLAPAHLVPQILQFWGGSHPRIERIAA